MKTKSVEWSYPTSPNAKGFPNGCWSVEVAGEAVAHYAARREAVEHADRLPEPWACYAREASVAIQCHCPVTGRLGDWLFTGDDWRAPGSRVSPVLPDFYDFLLWAKANGWTQVPGDAGRYTKV